MVKRPPLYAFTLLELMITLTIIAAILGLGIVTLRGYIPKQRLITSVSRLENMFSRAQSEANARSYWTCVKFTSGNPIEASLYADVSGDHATGTDATACGTGDTLLVTEPLKKNVSFPTGSGCTKNTTSSCVIWFDTTGAPKRCASSGTGCGTSSAVAAGSCEDFTYQVVLSTADLETLARAREIEVLSGGLVQTPKPGQKGLDTTLWASAPTATGGCE